MLLFVLLCTLIAHLYTLDNIMARTRHPSVIYSYLTNNNSKKKTQQTLHHDVLFNAKFRDTHPYASPEGTSHKLLRGDAWLHQNGILGAVMQLTALRQPSTKHDKPSPQGNNLGKQSKHPPTTNNNYQSLFAHLRRFFRKRECTDAKVMRTSVLPNLLFETLTRSRIISCFNPILFLTQSTILPLKINHP